MTRPTRKPRDHGGPLLSERTRESAVDAVHALREVVGRTTEREPWRRVSLMPVQVRR